MTLAERPAATPRDSTILATIEAIYVTPVGSGAMEARDEVRAVARKGLEGDRYFAGLGTYSKTPGSGRGLTMIDGALLDSLEREHGVRLSGAESRRNLVVRGVQLATLLGRRLLVGEALCEVARDCPPCAHLESLTRPGVMKAMVERGGIRLEILRDGVIRRGDRVREA